MEMEEIVQVWIQMINHGEMETLVFNDNNIDAGMAVVVLAKLGWRRWWRRG